MSVTFFTHFFFFFTALKRIHSKNLFARQRSSVWGGDPECWSRCCADSKGPSVGKLDLARATSQEDLDRPSEEVEVYFLLQSFCSHRGLNLLAVTWVLVCGAPCVCCMYTYVHRPVEGKSWDQAGISQPVFVAKSHFMYTKYKENSIFNLVFLEDFSFRFSKVGTWSMNFILLYHNHLAHKWARWPFIYFSCIFILYFAVVFFILVVSHRLSLLPHTTSLEWIWVSSSVIILEDTKEEEVKGKVGHIQKAVANSIRLLKPSMRWMGAAKTASKESIAHCRWASCL